MSTTPTPDMIRPPPIKKSAKKQLRKRRAVPWPWSVPRRKRAKRTSDPLKQRIGKPAHGDYFTCDADLRGTPKACIRLPLERTCTLIIILQCSIYRSVLNGARQPLGLKLNRYNLLIAIDIRRQVFLWLAFDPALPSSHLPLLQRGPRDPSFRPNTCLAGLREVAPRRDAIAKSIRANGPFLTGPVNEQPEELEPLFVRGKPAGQDQRFLSMNSADRSLHDKNSNILPGRGLRVGRVVAVC